MESINNRVQHCINCGLNGHVSRNCLSPVTSYGIIAVRYTDDVVHKALYSKSSNINNRNNEIQFLLIQRKDSLSFVEIIRGKYNPSDIEYITRLLRGMTIKEQDYLLKMTFSELWFYVWGETPTSKSHKNDYDASEKKFDTIKSYLPELIKSNPSEWVEPEWGFPKGRRNPRESDLNCAIREFQEETGLSRNDIEIIQNTEPISETFLGSNNVHYCHKYYIAVCDKSLEVAMDSNNPHMVCEIGSIKWCCINEAISKIRPDNIEKREILLKAGKIMRNFYPIQNNELPHFIRNSQ